MILQNIRIIFSPQFSQHGRFVINWNLVLLPQNQSLSFYDDAYPCKKVGGAFHLSLFTTIVSSLTTASNTPHSSYLICIKIVLNLSFLQLKIYFCFWYTLCHNSLGTPLFRNMFSDEVLVPKHKFF